MTTALQTREGEAAVPQRFPFRFFLITFGWSWLIWLPLVLAGMGIIPLRKELLDTLTVPWIAVGVFPTIVMAQGAGQQRYWLWAGFTLLAGVVAMIARSRVSC